MTNDKEEREALRCCPDCKLRIFVVNGLSEWRCDGCGNTWVKAPKHDDEEFRVLFHSYKEALTRIKELEHEAKYEPEPSKVCPMCGGKGWI